MTDTDETTGLYALRGISECGVAIWAGPVDIGEGVLLVDRHMAPNGWVPEFVPLLPVDKAIRVFTVTPRPEPVLGADLFAALRRTIITDPDNDGADCPRAAALIVHVEAHRPLQMWTGDEECLLSECDHDDQVDGHCPGLVPAEQLCRTCSAVYDSGSEYGPEWLAACRVEWPCPPVRAVLDHYGMAHPACVAR